MQRMGSSGFPYKLRQLLWILTKRDKSNYLLKVFYPPLKWDEINQPPWDVPLTLLTEARHWFTLSISFMWLK